MSTGLADNRHCTRPVIEIRPNSFHKMQSRPGKYLDSTDKSPLVEFLIFLLDVAQIDLAAADDDADEGRVVRAPTFHGRLQPLGEILRAIIERLDWN